MNTSQIKNFAIQSRNVLKTGVLNRILALGFDVDGHLMVDRPVKIQGGTIFMGQLREEGFFDAWTALEEKIAKHSVKEVCEEAAYTWFNRLVAIRIMQKNGFIEPVMQYANPTTRVPVIVDQARSGRLTMAMSAADREKLNELLRDPTKTNEQFNLLISAYCLDNPVIFNCFGGIEKHIGLLLPDTILAQGGFIDMLNNTPYITDEDYKQSELIGWLYQFYISERKDEVFAKKGIYTPDEIPAATQIFTPNWIVKYMVENTVGRIYLDNNPYAEEIKGGMKYLVEPAEPTPEDAILKLDDLAEYKMIDAACGSGHILIEGFNLFYRMYMYEGYAPRAAIENILRKNIIGLDLDTRAKQLATFALLMTAAKLDKSFLDCNVMPRVLDFPEPFVYRGGLMKEFLAHYFLGGNQKIIEETEKAFELMKQADSLGSVMMFDISPETRAAIERSTSEWEKHEFVNHYIEAAIPSMKVILALTDKYTAAVMNPPYMGGVRFDPILSSYVNKHYHEGRSDLFAVFMLLGMRQLLTNGKMGMINMHSWMFLGSFENLRTSFVAKYQIDNLLHLGPRTFDELSGDVVQNVAFVLSKKKPHSMGVFYRLVSGPDCTSKERLFFNQEGVFLINQLQHFEKIPGTPIGYWVSTNAIELFEKESVQDHYIVRNGISTGDNTRYLRLWFELSKNNTYWKPCNKGGEFRKWYGNNEYYVWWKDDGHDIRTSLDEKGRIKARLGGIEFSFQAGIEMSRIISDKLGFRYSPGGFVYESSTNDLYSKPDGKSLIPALGYLNSKVSAFFLRLYNPTINVMPDDIRQLPFIWDASPSLADLVSNSIYISQSDWDSHETSWDFKKNELILLKERGLGTTQAGWGDTITLVRISVPMLLAEYKAKWNTMFDRLHSNEETLNRQFIELYGLQKELTPDVPLDEITILQKGEISIVDNQIVWHDDVIVKQFISYAIGCWMGRYRLDKEGLYIAHYPTEEEVCSYQYNGQSFEIDDDAIIPLMGRDNPFEDDNALQKTVDFVKIVFGEDNLTENLNYIEHCLGKSIEDYLVKDFWKGHKKMYQNRPIYWLFSSKKGAFQVLVYMHRMNPYTAEKIRTKYLLPYIEFLKGKIEVDEARGADLTAVERKNLARMQAALNECIEYHDRLHGVAIKAIDFDLDDGVVVNYAKFGDVLSKLK